MNELSRAAKTALNMLSSCCICPRKCKVNRLKGEPGFCKTGINAKVCSYMAHHGEEPAISGSAGSGTIFFSNCNMACAYCQNYEFSQQGQGKEVSTDELAEFMLELQRQGCHNINLVTPTHVMPQILKSLEIAASLGLKIPIVYNTSGYELTDALKLLEGIVDVYLADMRYADPKMALKYSNAPDYPLFNREAVKEMHRQVGVAKMDARGIIKRGLIIRHLVLPNGISGTATIMKFIAEEISPDTCVSLMSQYRPYYNSAEFPELNRILTREEYGRAKQIMEEKGLYNGWTQDDCGLERYAGVHIKASLKRDAG